MAAVPTLLRRPTRTPARPRSRNPAEQDSEPPAKRRKHTPARSVVNDDWVRSDEEREKARNVKSSPFDEETITVNVNRRDAEEIIQAVTPAAPTDPQTSPKRSARSRTQTRPRRDRDKARSRGGPVASPKPRYSSAAAAAAASQANDGYKPREERSWEDFHPDLDIEAVLFVFAADEVDGRPKSEHRPSLLRQDTSAADAEESTEVQLMNGEPPGSAGRKPDTIQEMPMITPKRRPGRPPRKPESMLSGLGSPPAPRINPLPTHNPKERLNLPKPCYKRVATFKTFEEDKKVRVEDYVDKAMAHVGYQESERFEAPQDILIRYSEGLPDDDMGAGLVLESDEKPADLAPPQVGDVEYDMDEQDEKWLEAHNIHRKSEQADPIKPSHFEITMTQIEREYYALEKRIPKPNPRHPNVTRPRSSSAAAVNGEPAGPGDEPDSKCAICDDGDCENANAIIFCDGCDLAVHQECYGVPFIPEGQWFCRKCKEIGRGTPTCIFCPNIDGAFKQTNTLRWSHLLCAIWIPEVSIANVTFMEPIQDVEKVPRGRWSLVCYICQQRMGACIQCGNKACYQAFHVTCARRARLFLKMKSSQAGGIDTSVLKAFCDRHVPSDWRRDHDVDNAIQDAKRYYRRTMRDRQWADSQTAALTINPQTMVNMPDVPDELGQGEDAGTIVVAGNKRKKKEPLKTGWRLPSGAPVVPAAVFNAVEASMARFTIRKRKDFVAEACKYWTLKREARRGAALLKRLQLQLESFSSMEITRRNFVGMGAAGRPRLLRRIEFADMLSNDMDRLEVIIEQVTQREQKKLEDADTLRQLIDTVYFPISDLVWPILKKAQKLDEKTGIFRNGLGVLEQRLSERHYSSVAAFSADIGSVLAEALTSPPPQHDDQRIQDVTEIDEQLHEGPLTAEQQHAFTLEQKQRKALAKRITKAIKEPLEDALRKEFELKGIPYEKEMRQWSNLDARLDYSISNSSRRVSLADVSATAGASPNGAHNVDIDMVDAPALAHEASTINGSINIKKRRNTDATTISAAKDQPIQAPSPPISSSSSRPGQPASISETSTNVATPMHNDPWSRGGVPWYMRPFDPSGTTVHDERWTGPEQIRAMSEPLSDMDEDTLNDLNPAEVSKAKKASPKKAPKASTTRSTRARRSAVKEAELVEDVGEEDDEEPDAEREAKEKRDRYNAKRRAMRRSMR